MGRAASVGAGVNWLTLGVIAAFHLGALAALFFFSWQRLLVMLVLYVVAINVGIGMCYHRLLTHRGYQVPKWLEYVMATCATLALEGGPIFWVATHRVHHQHSDQEGDPHTPREGGWWAHTGWILWGNTLHMQTDVLGRYTPDLTKDRYMVWLSKYHWIPLVVSGMLLFGLGWLTGGPVNAVGMLGPHNVVLSVMEYSFIGGSMGAVVGETIARAVDRSLASRNPLIIVSSSGGARMMEGIASLMQLAKVSAGLARLDDAKIPYISVMTDPTTGGVTASFAMLGDLNIAEPNALIGFAGPRVIEQTIRQKLPPGFQRSEFLLEHGFLDAIVPRKDMKPYLNQTLSWMTA